jgi:hypothetical protein
VILTAQPLCSNLAFHNITIRHLSATAAFIASMENLGLDEPDMDNEFFMTVRQVELLEKQINDWAILDNTDKPDFLQARFREAWSVLDPSWDWNAPQPSLHSTTLMDQRYHWTRQVCA